MHGHARLLAAASSLFNNKKKPMTVLRCTQKLLDAMRVQPVPLNHPPEGPPSKTLLGDWTLHLLYVGEARLILAVSEHDRLGLVLEAAPIYTLPQRFLATLYEHLHALGVPPEIAQRECNAMQPFVVAATRGRNAYRAIQGNMIIYMTVVKQMLQQGSPLAQINARMAEHAFKSLGYACPRELVRRRFGVW